MSLTDWPVQRRPSRPESPAAEGHGDEGPRKADRGEHGEAVAARGSEQRKSTVAEAAMEF